MEGNEKKYITDIKLMSVAKWGCCLKVVSKSAKALFCKGSCQSWFHINCVDISSDEYQLCLKLHKKALWICKCCADNGPASSGDSVSNEDLDKVNITYIKILTDQIVELTNNQKHLKELISHFEDYNRKLKNALTKQAGMIAVLITRDGLSYANTVKFDKNKLFANETTSSDCYANLLEKNSGRSVKLFKT